MFCLSSTLSLIFFQNKGGGSLILFIALAGGSNPKGPYTNHIPKPDGKI